LKHKEAENLFDDVEKENIGNKILDSFFNEENKRIQSLNNQMTVTSNFHSQTLTHQDPKRRYQDKSLNEEEEIIPL